MRRADPRAIALQALTSVHGIGAVMAKELVDEKGIDRCARSIPEEGPEIRRLLARFASRFWDAFAHALGSVLDLLSAASRRCTARSDPERCP